MERAIRLRAAYQNLFLNFVRRFLMNAKVEKAAFAGVMPVLNPGEIAFSGLLNPIGRGIVNIVTTFQIACIVTNQADRYYAMDDAQLERIGLTRNKIPAVLVRLFTELE
jgi:hypothetical protein